MKKLPFLVMSLCLVLIFRPFSSYSVVTLVDEVAADKETHYQGVRIEFEHTGTKDGIRRRYLLRNLQETANDLAYLGKMFGDPTTMARYMEGIPRPAAEIERRFHKYIGWWKESPWSTYLLFEVPEAGGEEFRGQVMVEPSDREANALKGIDEHPRLHTEAELSYIILHGETRHGVEEIFWHNGLGTAAVSALIQEWVIPLLSPTYPLHGYSITSLYATALDENIASGRILLKNGFRRTLTTGKFGAQRGFYELSLNGEALEPVTKGYWKDTDPRDGRVVDSVS